MALRLIYQMLTTLLGWLVLRARSDTAKEIEILVLRRQLAVLPRRTPRPPMSWVDRALTAALTRLLPTSRRLGLLVTPATILRWHRQLVTRRWTSTPSPPGRPAIPAGLRALVLRLARGEPHLGYRRIHGAAIGLDYRIGASTVWTILHLLIINQRHAAAVLRAAHERPDERHPAAGPIRRLDQRLPAGRTRCTEFWHPHARHQRHP